MHTLLAYTVYNHREWDIGGRGGAVRVIHERYDTVWRTSLHAYVTKKNIEGKKTWQTTSPMSEKEREKGGFIVEPGVCLPAPLIGGGGCYSTMPIEVRNW